jgi:hypothetical protein
VVWKQLYLSPLFASRSAVGVWHGPPNALDAPKPYAVRQSPNFNIFLGARLTDTDPERAKEALAQLQMYPYAQRDNPPKAEILEAGTRHGAACRQHEVRAGGFSARNSTLPGVADPPCTPRGAITIINGPAERSANPR